MPVLLLGLLLVFIVLGGMLAVMVVVPYWSAERRGRARWRAVMDDVTASAHPYRMSRVASARDNGARAPAMVRAAAMMSFVWAWCCLGWSLMIAYERHVVDGAAVSLRVLPSLVVAFFVQRAARLLLARRAGARPVAYVQAVHAIGLIGFGMLAESIGIDEALGDLGIALGVGAAIQAAMIYAATSGPNAVALARA